MSSTQTHFPTPSALLQVIIDDLDANVVSKQSFSFLDIGTGDCALHDLICSVESTVSDFLRGYDVITDPVKTLTNPKAQLVGTDVLETDLSRLESGISFTNPPYALYDTWLLPIIKTTVTPLIYAILPSQWQTNSAVLDALQDRQMTATVLHQETFADMPTLHVVRIHHASLEVPEQFIKSMGKPFYSPSPTAQLDPLKALFARFKGTTVHDRILQAREDEKRLIEIFESQKLDGLLACYRQEMAKLQQDIQALSQLDPHLLQLFKIDGIFCIDADIIVSTLQAEMSNLRKKYWGVFFTGLTPISQRLTPSNRSYFKRAIEYDTQLDFTKTNAKAVTLQAIQRANDKVIPQIVDLFVDHMDFIDNLECYRSYQRVLTHEFVRGTDEQYIQKNFFHTKLKKQLTVHRSPTSSFESVKHQDVIEGYLAVARTLGFRILDYYISVKGDGDVDFGKTLQVFNSEYDTLIFEIKFYKKGTYHVCLTDTFLLRLNTLIGQHFGWLTSADDLEELDDHVNSDFWSGPDYLPLSLSLGWE